MENKYLHLFDTENDFSLHADSEDYHIPYVSYTIESYRVRYNLDNKLFFTIVPATSGNIKFKTTNSLFVKTIEYSNDMIHWTQISSTTSGVNIPVSTSKKLYIRGYNSAYSNGTDVAKFDFNGINVNLSGNIMSLINYDTFDSEYSFTANNVFNNFFSNCPEIINIANLYLPATELTDSAYESMFENCTGLTSTPVMFATIFGVNSCKKMFKGCTSLTSSNITVYTSTKFKYIDNTQSSGMHYDVLSTAPNASYGFTLNSNGYYESRNKGIHGSAAVCRINFTMTKSKNINIEFINNGEGSYDYGLFGNIDTALDTSTTVDASSKLKLNCYTAGYNSTTVRTLTYTIPIGEHFIDIKYRKDSSGNSGLDSLQWKIVEENTGLSEEDIAYYILNSGASEEMFNDCINLEQVHNFSVNRVYSTSLRRMFYNCPKLVKADICLNALTLDTSCYEEMFYKCTKLTDVPELYSTKLAQYCYRRMFSETNITDFVLPAETLANGCYEEMFKNCTSFYELEARFLNEPSIDYTKDWLTNVREYGVFIKNADAEYDVAEYLNVNGINYGIPLKWVENAFSHATILFQPLTFKFLGVGNWKIAKSESSFTDDGVNVYYRKNNGSWIHIIPDTQISVVTGDIIEVKSSLWNSNSYSYYYFNSTADYEVYGNIMSLISLDNFGNIKTISKDYQFRSLFYNQIRLKSINNLVLPATTLSRYCYYNMFSGCNRLTVIPNNLLPAENLVDYCYSAMFSGCEKLEAIPATLLNSKHLANYCYQSMFSRCKTLESIPETLLPATTLAEGCYQNMFGNCTKIRTIPVNLLHAEYLVRYCYQIMFQNTGIIELNDKIFSSIIAESACDGMFRDCNELTTVGPDFLGHIEKIYSHGLSYLFNGCSNLKNIPNKLFSDNIIFPDNSSYQCSYMFGNTGIEEIPQTFLNVQELKQYCYDGMFEYCHNLTTLPSNLLNGASLANNCCEGMFNHCNGLITLPENLLPTIELASHCYANMFSQCANLIETCKLPAVDLETNCYAYMFYNCPKLVTVKQILAENVGSSSCTYMFYNCDSLSTISNLKFKKIDNNGCQYMFYDCDTLEEITFDNDITLNGEQCCNYMFHSCDNLRTVNIVLKKCEFSSCCAYMFSSCTNLVNGITIDTENVGSSSLSHMFSSCTNLTNILCTIGFSEQNTNSLIAANGCNSMFDNCHNLLGTINFYATVINDNGCYMMFNGCTRLTGLSQLKIKTVSYRSCYKMFYECSSLIDCSSIAIENLGEESCYQMFYKCTSLSIVPNELPCRMLKPSCYYGMFEYCSALTTSPKLPALELATGCYQYMFEYCSNLVNAGEISARILANNCCKYMFEYCSSLVVAPILYSRNLVSGCYSDMFDHCSNLNYICAMFITEPSNTYTQYWVNGVATYGTFVQGKGATWTTRGTNAIPTNWNIVSMDDSAIVSTKEILIHNENAFTEKIGITATKSYTISTDSWITLDSYDGASGYKEFTVSTSSTNQSRIGMITISDGTAQYEIIVKQILSTSVENDELTFYVESPGAISFKCITSTLSYHKEIEYKLNDGNWTSFIIPSGSTTSIITEVNTGDIVKFRGNNTAYSTNTGSYTNSFVTSCKFALGGNIMSLVDSTNFASLTECTANYTFYKLFSDCKNLESTELLNMPATTVTNNCYGYMFQNCSNLKTISTKPIVINSIGSYSLDSVYYGCSALENHPSSITINGNTAEYCFSQMFYNCKSLTSMPELTINGNPGNYCFYAMFYGCINLLSTSQIIVNCTSCGTHTFEQMFNSCSKLVTLAPVKMTMLSSYCCNQMYIKCTRLKTVQLPVKLDGSIHDVLATYCYLNMFSESGIETVPQLGNVTLAAYCYQDMFKDCKSLTTINHTFANIQLASNCYREMFMGCTALQTAPSLLSESLANGCYYGMFNGCTNLRNVMGILPATTLADNCYCMMFYRCTSITNTPIFSSIETKVSCYQQMFSECTSLIDSGLPTLAATQLANNCYNSMFENCVKLTRTPNITAQTVGQSSMQRMFANCTKLEDASHITINDTKTSVCYEMFIGCSSLVNAPTINASTLTGTNVFKNMFSGCTSLINFQQTLLPTTLTNNCYESMFFGCTKLVSAPEIKATTLGASSCLSMFENCSSLETVQEELYSLTLKDSCYKRMFYGCSKLQTAPSLPATQLVTYCYEEMFSGCSKLNRISANFLTEPGENYTKNWVANVASSGFFEGNEMKTWQNVGPNGIPEGWLTNIFEIYTLDFEIHRCKTNLPIEGFAYNSSISITTDVNWITFLTNTDLTIRNSTFTTNVEISATSELTRTGHVIFRDVYTNKSYTVTIIQRDRNESIDIDLNGQWVVAGTITTTINGRQKTVTYYKSDSNYNVANGKAQCSITAHYMKSLSISVRTYGQYSYDYLVVSKVNTAAVYPDDVSGDSTKNTWSGYQKYSSSTYTKLEFNDLPDTATINLIYGKNGSTNSNDDRAYFYIETEPYFEDCSPNVFIDHINLKTNKFINLGVINQNNNISNDCLGKIDILFKNTTGGEINTYTILTDTYTNTRFSTNATYLYINNSAYRTGTTTCTDYLENGQPNEYALFRLVQNSEGKSMCLFRESNSTNAIYYEWPISEQPFDFTTDTFYLNNANGTNIAKVIIYPPFDSPIELLPKNNNDGYHMLYDSTNNIEYNVQ